MAIPLIWTVYFLFYKPQTSKRQLEKFIEPHLLKFLIIEKKGGKQSGWKSLFLWSIVWTLLTLALAGPRWNFREVEVSTKDQSLVILLDLSESMNATDVRPSRLVRAKQKIEDLLNGSQGVKIGLIAFAADPHMIAPLTEDKEMIRHLLPSLETDLVYVQGSRLSSAFEMAAAMLQAEPGNNKSLLVISDGDFEDGAAVAAAKKVADAGVVIYTMGIGTIEGAILQDKQGNNLKKKGMPILSKLVKTTLEDIAKLGKGNYLDGKNSAGEGLILKQLETRAEVMAAGQKKRLWNEHFYLLLLPVLPIILWWLRRGSIFSFVFLLFLPCFQMQASLNESYFMNSEERGKWVLDQGEYELAAEFFVDPYCKGVAHYKAGNFIEAEKKFREASSQDVSMEASYNLGNSLVQQRKFKAAIAVYEDVLKQWPEHLKARENLELVKKMMDQQKKENKQKNDASDEKNDSHEDRENSESQDQNSQNSQRDLDNKSQNNDSQNSKESENREHENNSDESQDENPSDPSEDKEEQQQSAAQADKHPEPGEKEGEQQADEAESENQDSSADAQEQQLEEEKGKKDEKNQLSDEEKQEADFWLNRLSNDPKNFMKNKFYIETKKNGTKEGIDPW